MGSTVSSNRKIAAFRDDGKIIYVGFESTYEKNCYPHKPNWSPVFIGDYKESIQSIFKFGSVCEGGMLQDHRGYVLPEVYIARWLRALANPIPMPNWTVEFEDKSTGLLHERYRDVAVAHREGRGLWRILGTHAPDGSSDKAIGYSPKPVPDSGLPPLEGRFMACGPDARLQLGDGGVWVPVGWKYSVVEQFIRSYAKIEIDHPGHYATRISAYRKLVHEATACPADAIVHVSDPLTLDQYDGRAATRLREQFGAEFCWGDLLLHEEARSLAYDALNPRICIWEVLSDAHVEINKIPGEGAMGTSRQEMLF